MNSGKASVVSSFGTKIGKIIRLVRLIRLLRIMKALSQTNKKAAVAKKTSNKVAPMNSFQSIHSMGPNGKRNSLKKIDLTQAPTSKDGRLRSAQMPGPSRSRTLEKSAWRPNRKATRSAAAG